MRAKASVGVLATLLVVLFGLGGCAPKKEGLGFFVPSMNEEWIGTWVNTTDTLPSYGYQKIINTSWGYYEVFRRIDDPKPTYIGCSTLVKKWQDRNGDIWYREFDRGPTIPQGFFILNRISENGSVLEWVESESTFPTEEDLTAKKASLGYCILYRE
jgi:hypothetical protein